MKILAIDLGKNKSVFCLLESTDMSHQYGKLDTTPQAMHDLITRLAPQRVVIEIGPAAGWVTDLCRALDVAIQVANVNHEAWQWRKTKKKTDRVDALKLARLSAMNQLPLVDMPTPDVRQWRSLIEFRRGRVADRTAIKNHIHSLFDTQGVKIPSGKKAWTQKAVKHLWTYAKPLADCSDTELWRGQLKLDLEALAALEQQISDADDRLQKRADADTRVAQLRSCPGVGPRLAETVVAFIDNPHRFESAKQVASYAGLAPRQFQSGQMNRSGRISKQGAVALRTMLVEVAWIGQRYNPWIKSTYQRLKRGSKGRAKIAVVATARALLVRLWAMLRDGTRWRCSTSNQSGDGAVAPCAGPGASKRKTAA